MRTFRSLYHLSKKYKIWIPDIYGDKHYGFSANQIGKEPNFAGLALLNLYCNDLKLPRPPYFSTKPWKKSGIYTETEADELELYRLLRSVSSIQQGYVFLLWGASCFKYEAAIEPNRNHLVIISDYPGTAWAPDFDQSNQFSLACKHLGLPKDIWRLR